MAYRFHAPEWCMLCYQISDRPFGCDVRRLETGGMQRAAHAALQAARLHAAATHAATAAAAAGLTADAPLLQWLRAASCLPSLGALSSTGSAGSFGGCTAPQPRNGSSPISSFSPEPGVVLDAVGSANGQSPAALLLSQQFHSTTAGFAVLPFSRCGGGSSSSIPAVLSSGSEQMDSRQQSAGTSGSAAPGIRYRGYASRATQALTKGQAPPPGGQAISMRIAVASPNQIAEPYR